MNNESPPVADETKSGKGDSTLSVSALRYAGFWRRVGAYLLDFIVILPFTGLTYWLSDTSRMTQLIFFIPGLLFGLWFHVYLVKLYGGTPGKLVLKIRIARLDGSAVGYREALVRYSVLFVLSGLASVAMLITILNMSDSGYLDYMSLGFKARNTELLEMVPSWFQPVDILLNVWIYSEFIVMLTNKRRRALHDFMAGTIVVRAAS